LVKSTVVEPIDAEGWLYLPLHNPFFILISLLDHTYSFCWWYYNLNSGLQLLGRHCITWVKPPAFFALVIFHMWSCFYAQADLNHDPPFTLSRMTGMYTLPSFYWFRWSLMNFFLAGHKLWSSKSASWVASGYLCPPLEQIYS
jgi:hypothetical protein